MKQILKRVIPAPVLRGYHRVLRSLEARRNERRSMREVFSDFYVKQRKWSAQPFNSGRGSTEQRVVDAYVAVVAPLISGARVVDLGCGDFNIGARLLNSCASYEGIDVVPELIEHLRSTVRSDKARFRCLDILNDDLPEGEICMVRQVFQHMSNSEILTVLPKLRRYHLAIITEHHPTGDKIIPNIDKTHGTDIRLYKNSGVYLDKPPFSLSGVRQILEVSDGQPDPLYPPGVIRTFVVEH